jgi:hypothetical protein
LAAVIAEDAGDTRRLQPLPGQTGQIGQPLSVPKRLKMQRRSGCRRQKCRANFIADLKN